jgi:hypothetical protein
MLAAIDWNEGTIAITLSLLIPVVAIISGAWYKIERMRSENGLKRSMVERGMSVDEIERVLSARSRPLK